MKKLFMLTSLALTACGPTFAPEDITQIEEQIRADYASRGVTVTEVSFIETGEGQLKGFAKVTDDDSGEEYLHDCTADSSADQQNYVWRCSPS